jgi:transketolase
MASIQELKNVASQIRRDIVEWFTQVQSGHPGGSLGCADYFTALFFHTMQHDTKFSMDGKNEDLFFLIEWTYFSCILFCTGKFRLF